MTSELIGSISFISQIPRLMLAAGVALVIQWKSGHILVVRVGMRELM